MQNQVPNSIHGRYKISRTTVTIIVDVSNNHHFKQDKILRNFYLDLNLWFSFVFSSIMQVCVSFQYIVTSEGSILSYTTALPVRKNLMQRCRYESSVVIGWWIKPKEKFNEVRLTREKTLQTCLVHFPEIESWEIQHANFPPLYCGIFKKFGPALLWIKCLFRHSPLKCIAKEAERTINRYERHQHYKELTVYFNDTKFLRRLLITYFLSWPSLPFSSGFKTLFSKQLGALSSLFYDPF